MKKNSFLKTKDNWIAKWIWNNEESSPNTWMCFRKTINIDKIPQYCKAFISVDSKYWLWINGKQVVFEGGLNRGPKPDAGYYDMINLDCYVVQGLNTISILVWYWGNEGRNSINSGKGGLLFQLEADDTVIVSDNSWKSLKHPAYIETDAPHPAPLYGGHNIGFDARLDVDNWHLPIFDDSDWNFANEMGLYKTLPWGELFERTIPEIKNYGVLNYAKISNNDNATIVADLPYASHICPIFVIDAQEEGLKIDIRTDRYEINGGPGDNNKYINHRTEYITKKGIQAFESLDWLFCEKVYYSFHKNIKVLSVQYRMTGYKTGFAGSFMCNDKFLNELYEKCKRTLYICIRDNYMDCPDRERGQWIGDVSVQIPQTFYSMDRDVDLMTKKSIHDFILWAEEGVLRGNVPGIHCSELPSQSLNAISELGMIMSYYLHSGDSSVLYLSYKPIINYLSLWEFDENGNLLPRRVRKGAWHWFDHGDNIDAEVLEYCWYYTALKSAKAIAEIINNEEDFEFLNTRIDNISSKFDKLYWDGTAYRSIVLYDDRANAMAVIAGLASKEKWESISNILMRVRNSTPYMEVYVLEALCMMDYKKEAMQRMRERYSSLVANENSTLWEDFYELGTRNHAWSGGALTILSKYIAGIYPLEAGYSTFQILPNLVDLNKLNTVVPSIRGEIKSVISKTDREFTLSLISPSNTTAVVGIPKKIFSSDGQNATIFCNDVCILDDGKFVPALYMLGKFKDDENYIKFKVSCGKWNFKVEF